MLIDPVPMIDLVDDMTGATLVVFWYGMLLVVA